MGWQEERQTDFLLSWRELPRSAGHPFYDRLQEVLLAADFDLFVEDLCRPYYSSSPRGRKSLPPGRFFRILLVGSSALLLRFEGLDSECGIETPTADDLVRIDRKCPGKKLSDEDRESPTDPDARIAKVKDGCTRLGYKPEHAVDPDTGIIVAGPVHGADQRDTKTLPGTLETAEVNLEAAGSRAPRIRPSWLRTKAIIPGVV